MSVEIGDKFLLKRKEPTEYEVVDIYTVINSAGKTVNTYAIAKSTFMGQEMRTEFPLSTVILNKI